MKIPFRFRMFLYAVCALLFLSGVLWEWLDRFVLVSTAIGSQKHPAQPWILRLHGAAALLSVFMLGQLYVSHVRPSWRLGRKRATGGLLLALIGSLVVSGYLLYYASGEELRSFTSSAHFWLGAAAPMPFFLHLFRKAR